MHESARIAVLMLSTVTVFVQIEASIYLETILNKGAARCKKLNEYERLHINIKVIYLIRLSSNIYCTNSHFLS